MASGAKKKPPPMTDLCTTRQSKTQRFTGPTWELRCLRWSADAGDGTVFHVHDNVLESSQFRKLKHDTDKRVIQVTCGVKILTMIIDFLYTGEYSPTVQDIECMDPDTRDMEAKTQLGLYYFTKKYNEHRLMDLAMCKIAACDVSPRGFLDVFMEYQEAAYGQSAFSQPRMWCATWVRDHLHKLLASEEFKSLVEAGQDYVGDLLDLLGSYSAILEGANSLKRGSGGENDGRPSKASRHGGSTT